MEKNIMTFLDREDKIVETVHVTIVCERDNDHMMYDIPCIIDMDNFMASGDFDDAMRKLKTEIKNYVFNDFEDIKYKLSHGWKVEKIERVFTWYYDGKWNFESVEIEL